MAKTAEQNNMSPLLAAGIALGAVTAAALFGRRASPTPKHERTQRWYKRLDKPGFTPPAPVYAIAWTGIQAGLAYGGYKLLRADASRARTTALALWAGNQVGIGGWSKVFFGNRAPGRGTIASAALGANAFGYVAAAGNVDKTAARTGMPLVAWVGFATLLSEEIWRRNNQPAEKNT